MGSEGSGLPGRQAASNTVDQEAVEGEEEEEEEEEVSVSVGGVCQPHKG